MNNYQLSIFKKMAEVKDIEVQILGSGPLYVHISENNPLAHKEIVNIKEFFEYPRIHLPYDFFSNLNLSLSIDGFALSEFKRSIIMSNYHAIINMINHADALMLGNKWQVEELKYSHIKSIEIENSGITMNFVIIKRKRDTISNAGQVFLDILHENYDYI